MAETPPGSFPVVSEGTIVRFRLGALVAVIVFVSSLTIGATVWATNIANRLESLDQRMARFEKALGIDTVIAIPTHAAATP